MQVDREHLSELIAALDTAGIRQLEEALGQSDLLVDFESARS